MPTSAITTFTAANRLDPVFTPEDAETIQVQLAASTIYAKGTVLGEVAATPGTYKPYASGNSDGSQNPAGILKWGCSTDASGNITVLGEFGATQKSVEMYMRGYFKTSELTGLDANAVTKMGGLLVEGDTSSGIFRF